MNRNPEKLSLERLALLEIKAPKYLMKQSTITPTAKKGTYKVYERVIKILQLGKFPYQEVVE